MTLFVLAVVVDVRLRRTSRGEVVESFLDALNSLFNDIGCKARLTRPTLQSRCAKENI